MALADGEYRALIQKRLREDFRQLPDAERRGTLKIGEEGVHWVSDLKPETNFFLRCLKKPPALVRILIDPNRKAPGYEFIFVDGAGAAAAEHQTAFRKKVQAIVAKFAPPKTEMKAKIAGGSIKGDSRAAKKGAQIGDAMLKAGVGSAPAPTGLSEDQQAFLSTDVKLQEQYADLVLSGAVPPQDFWRTQQESFEKFIIGRNKQLGRDSRVRSHSSTMTIARRNQILTMQPAVMRQYQDQVQTGDMTEQEFWQNFMNVKTYRDKVREGMTKDAAAAEAHASERVIRSFERSEQAAELPRQQRLQEQARHLHHADVDLIATAEDSARSAVPLPQRIAGSQRGYGSRGGYGTGDRMNAYTSRNPAVGIDRTVKVAATSDMDKDDSRFREINTYATTVVSDIDAHGDSPVEAQTEPTGTSNNSGEAAGSETAVSKKRKRSNSAAAGGGDGEGSGGANTVYDDGNVGEATLPELFGRAAVLDPEEAAVPLRVQARAFLAMLRGEQGRDEEGTGGDENRRSAGAGAGQAGYAALLARGTTAERKAMSATVQNASRATIYSGNSFAWATRYLVKHIYECKYKNNTSGLFGKSSEAAPQDMQHLRAQSMFAPMRDLLSHFWAAVRATPLRMDVIKRLTDRLGQRLDSIRQTKTTVPSEWVYLHQAVQLIEAQTSYAIQVGQKMYKALAASGGTAELAEAVQAVNQSHPTASAAGDNGFVPVN